MIDPRLALIVLKTKQVQVVRDFYARLGFVFVEEQHGRGPIHFSAPLGDGILEIYPLPKGKETDSTIRLGFAVSDVELVINSLDEFAEIVERPKQTEWGLRAVVRDPDGRVVEVCEASIADGTKHA